MGIRWRTDAAVHVHVRGSVYSDGLPSSQRPSRTNDFSRLYHLSLLPFSVDIRHSTGDSL